MNAENSPDRRWRLVPSVAAVAASAAMLYYGSGLHPRWWVMWLAMLPVLTLATRVRSSSAFAAAFAACALGELNLRSYLRRVEVPTPVILLFVLMTAAIFGLAVLLYRRYACRGALLTAALAFPATLVAIDFVTSLISPHGTFGSLAYTQMEFPAVLQLASFFGIWGIVFVLLFFQGAIAALITSGTMPNSRTRLAASLMTVVVAVVAFGELRLHDDVPGSAVSVGLIASDANDNFVPRPEASRHLLAAYAAQMRSLTAKGAQVIVAPEKLSVFDDTASAEVDALFQPLSNASGSVIVVGDVRQTAQVEYNEARVYRPEADRPLLYQKHHMIPGLESQFVAGTSRTLFASPSGVWGVEICKDLDFPALAREYGRDGVGLLLVPAWDFEVDDWLHDRMAVMRGVEGGFTIARAAKQGLLTISDSRGRVLHEVRSDAAPFASLVATVPVRHDATFYARFGDWFGWTNVLLLAALLAQCLVQRTCRARSAGPSLMTEAAARRAAAPNVHPR